MWYADQGGFTLWQMHTSSPPLQHLHHVPSRLTIAQVPTVTLPTRSTARARRLYLLGGLDARGPGAVVSRDKETKSEQYSIMQQCFPHPPKTSCNSYISLYVFRNHIWHHKNTQYTTKHHYIFTRLELDSVYPSYKGTGHHVPRSINALSHSKLHSSSSQERKVFLIKDFTCKNRLQSFLCTKFTFERSAIHCGRSVTMRHDSKTNQRYFDSFHRLISWYRFSPPLL